MFLDIVGEKGRTQKRKLDTKWHDDFERGEKLLCHINFLYSRVNLLGTRIFLKLLFKKALHDP